MSAVAGAVFAQAPLVSPRPVARPAVPLGPEALRLAAGADALIARARLGGAVSFAVADAVSGELLEARGANGMLPPASVTKAVTALYALEALGPQFRFRTRVVALGPVVDGEVIGDVALVGSGDPVLDTDALASLVKQLKDQGISKVSGRFLTYAGALPYTREIAPIQPDHLGYNPSVSGLNLNFNRVHFQWVRGESGWDVRMDARSETLRPAVSVARMKVVARDLPVYTYREAKGGVDEWTVAAGALGNGGTRWLPVRRPDLYAGEVMQVLARGQGIALPKAQAVLHPPMGTDLALHESPPLVEIVRGMLKYSTNLTAEVLGLTASAAGSIEASAAQMTAWCRARLGAQGARFVDHSGLSDRSRVSVADLVRMLVRAGQDTALRDLMKEIAPRDGEGKTDAQPGFRIVAKTGSLNFVSTLAGYMVPENGRPLAFAILTADMPRRAAIAPEDMERPDGARGWSGRSRALQHQLIHRWSLLHF